jgi:DNA repair protein RadC
MASSAAWPATEKPRERLLTLGAEHLSDAELLAVLLGTGAAGCSVGELAARLLARCGGLDGVMRSGAAQLAGFKGLGPARIAKLRAAVELGRRYMEGPAVRRRLLKTPQDAARCFRARLADLPYEAFGCLYLDTRHRVICLETLFKGTIDGATVYPREVLRRALQHNAAAVIVGHNHPSGNHEPSDADRQITLRLAKALTLVDIRLLDHLVVSRAGHASLAERGWI